MYQSVYDVQTTKAYVSSKFMFQMSTQLLQKTSPSSVEHFGFRTKLS